MRAPLTGVLLALAVSGCMRAPPSPTLNLAATRQPASLVLNLAPAPARQTLSIARSWGSEDVYQYDVALSVYDAETDGYVTPEPPLTASLIQKPVPATRAAFDGLAPTGRYLATVTARGNAGGTAPDAVLNAARPATAVFDLAAGEREQTVPIALDPTPFGLTLRLPSNATVPQSVPAWVTGLDASLQDLSQPASAPVTVRWTRDEHAQFTHVRGDRPYAITLGVRSATGRTTGAIPHFEVARADGAEQVVSPAFPPIVPPTGTILATHTIAGGAWGVAADGQDRVWVTRQHDDAVLALDYEGQPAYPAPIAVGDEPRGIAVSPPNGDVWVANFTSSSISRIAGGVRVSTIATGGGFWPRTSGIAVDAAGRVWAIAAPILGGNGSLHCRTATGAAVAGSPFTVGAKPAGIAIAPDTGDVWVTNSGANTVMRLSSAGALLGTHATGAVPGGVAIGPDGTTWVANSDGGTLSRFNPDGSPAGPAVAVGPGPSALAIDPVTGAIWVGLMGWNGIAKVAPDGTLLGAYPAGTFPSSIAIDRRGHVWIAGTLSAGAVKTGYLIEMAP